MLSPEDLASLWQEIERGDVPARFMEVCGTHTVSIARAGLKQRFPPSLELISGPGCPVCVTASQDIDFAIALTRLPNIALLTFGDMVRVPGSETSLELERAKGKDVRIIYSPFEALRQARENQQKEFVLLAIGFETTAPLIARTIQLAAEENIPNLSFFSLHKLIPPALFALLSSGTLSLDGFLLPGHVAAIIGSEGFHFLTEQFHLPGVIAGFEPEDVLLALFMLLRQKRKGKAEIEIEYLRAVRPEGNLTAKKIMTDVFETVEATWRGLGKIPQSGLSLRPAYASFDALARFPLRVEIKEEPAGCRCGEVLRGLIAPRTCPLFNNPCRPETPIGPCMVSSEGACAASYRYERAP